MTIRETLLATVTIQAVDCTSEYELALTEMATAYPGKTFQYIPALSNRDEGYTYTFEVEK